MSKSFVSTLWDNFKTLGIAAFVAFFCIRGFLFEPFRIPSGSMVPTLLVGDFLFVSKYSYGNRFPMTNWFFWQKDPARGDIAVFKKPDSHMPGSFFGFGDPMFIKRIIALPGDTVAYKDKHLFVNGEKISYTPVGTYAYTDIRGRGHTTTHYQENLKGVEHDILIEERVQGKDVAPMTVPEDMFVVMGDNRDNSFDSRFWSWPNWAFVPRHDLMGRAEFIWWSWDKNWHIRFDRFFTSLRAHLNDE